MISNDFYSDDTIAQLKEREKEIKCLYRVQEIVSQGLPIDDFLYQVVKHIWGGWQYPMITRVIIIFEDKVYKEPGWEKTEWMQSSDIIVDDEILGRIEVYYLQFKKLIVDSQFLPEEQKLLNAIAYQIGHYIFQKRLKKTVLAFGSESTAPAGQNELDTEILSTKSDIHWKWRKGIVQKIADRIDMEKMGLKAIYLIGSTKNATAGPASDIDLIVHFDGSPEQLALMKAWFEGWSLCLSEINLTRTGFGSDGLIDLHVITDKSIKERDSFASMIGSLNDGARLIKSR